MFTLRLERARRTQKLLEKEENVRFQSEEAVRNVKMKPKTLTYRNLRWRSTTLHLPATRSPRSLG